MSKVLVLFSGGLDSTVLLNNAVKEDKPENVVALNIFYGQKHHKEMEYAKWTCEKLGVKRFDCDLSPVFDFNPQTSSLLMKSGVEIAHKSYSEQLSELRKEDENATVNTYVPYRNGLFLSYATAVAIQLGCSVIEYGAHADDSAGRAYPDCTPEFINAQKEAIWEGSGYKVMMSAPLWAMNKSDVVALGLSLGMTHDDFKHTWSCYEGKDEPCKVCGTCIDRKRAFEYNGIFDID